MRRIHLIGAAAAALLLAIAVAAAYANAPTSETTFDTTAKFKPKNAGTKAKPTPEKVTLTQTGGSDPAGRSPQTTTDVIIQLPSTVRWYGKKWAKSKRCDAEKANNAHSDSGCPRGSRIGKGHVKASNSNETTGGKINEEIDLTAYVLTDGSLGLWLEATQPVQITTMLVGKISKKNTKISVHIPNNVQEPVPGVPTGIEVLNFSVTGKTKSKGKTYGALSSIGCKRKKWTVKTTSLYRDGGRKTDSASSRCSK
jgi:hypothetical protein